MPKKKCFIVTAEVEMAVWAESPEQAANIAVNGDALRDSYTALSPEDCYSRIACRMPNGWELENFVYGGDLNMTLGEALLLTDEYVDSRQQMAKMVARGALK